MFEFREVSHIEKKISMKRLFNSELTHEFVEAVFQAFCYGKSRETDLVTYTRTLEFLIRD